MNLIFHDLLGVILEVYIDDIVVKSDAFESHLADLRLAFDRMKKVWTENESFEVCFRRVSWQVFGFHYS